MKIQYKDKPIIIGKRVNLGAAVGSAAAAFAHFYPDNAPAIVAAAVPLTYALQVLVVNFLGVTTAES